MHIIFGKEQVDVLSNKYTVLELDTFQIGVNGPIITAYCAVDTIPLDEMPTLDETKTWHQQLIKEYGLRHWSRCLELLSQLHGKWNKQLDSFYQDLGSRIEKHKATDPGSTWSPVIIKN